MGEVGVHLDDILIVTLERPLETGDVGSAKTELPGAFHQMNALRILLNKPLHYRGSAVGRVVIDDQYIKFVWQR